MSISSKSLDAACLQRSSTKWVNNLRLRLRLINHFLEEKNTQEQPKPGA